MTSLCCDVPDLRADLRDCARPLDHFAAVWALVIPMMGTLLIPSIQGTTPAYMLALLSIPFCMFHQRYFVNAAIAALIWLTFASFSQAAILSTPPVNYGQLNLIEPNDSSVGFRGSMFTQSMYLLACVATFLFFRTRFRERWMTYLFAGAWFLVLYGIYEWLFFAIFGRAGDFLANRVFHAGAGEHAGSWSQSASVGGVQLLRLKSVTGEPSFFALVALPYLALAIGYGKKWLSAALILTLLLSFSTTSYLGLLAIAALLGYMHRRIDKVVVLAVAAGALIFVALYVLYPDTFTSMFTEKLSGKNRSGAERMFHMTYPFKFFARLPLPNQILGVGFGTTYLAGTLRALMDLGIVGLLLYLCFFLRPVLRLPDTLIDRTWKAAIGLLLFLYTFSAAELFYPTTWMLLGIAYRRLDWHSEQSVLLQQARVHRMPVSVPGHARLQQT